MKTKILVFIFTILTISSCTLIPVTKEFEKTMRTIRESIHRYKNQNLGNWTFASFVRCNSKVSAGGSITCMKERSKFQTFHREYSQI